MAATFNIHINQGADFLQDFGIEGDLGGGTVYGKLRKHYQSANSVAFTCTSNTDTSTIRLELNHVTTANLDPGYYVYDVNIAYAGPNTVQRIIEGIAIVSPTASY